jgi:hypothetical protein
MNKLELLGPIINNNEDDDDNDARSQDYDRLLKKLSTETFEATNRILNLCGDLKEKSFIMNNTLNIHNEQLNRIDNGLNKMDDDLNQVKNNLNYLKKSLFKSLFCCFGISKKKCSPFKYFMSKIRRKRTNNVPYIVVNDDPENEMEKNNHLKQSSSNKSIISLKKKESFTNPIENNNEKSLKVQTNPSNVKIDDNLKLIGSAIGDLQMMMTGFSQKIDDQAKKIETTAEKTQSTTEKVKLANKIGESLLGNNKTK